VLQDDGHLLGMLCTQPVRHAHAIGQRVEFDEEMMIAGQALFGRVREHAAHHAAQRLLGQEVVADLVCHGGLQVCAQRDSGAMLAGQAA